MLVIILIISIVIIVPTLIITIGEPPNADVCISVKSRQAFDNYNARKFFSENKEKLMEAENVIKEKSGRKEGTYTIRVCYVSPAGRKSAIKDITVQQYAIDMFKNDPSLLMSKGEYSKYIKEQQKKALEQKQHEYYNRVNDIIDCANKNRDTLVINGSQKQLDRLIGQAVRNN